MKRFIITAGLVLTVCAAAQAVTAVYAEFTYPTTTTWKLWLTECDWTGSLPITPSGHGISAFAIDVKGVTRALVATPSPVSLYDEEPYEVGMVGWGGQNTLSADPNRALQLFAALDPQVPNALFHGFGVAEGTFVPPAGWSTSAPYSWAAPGAPGSANPGVLVYSGKRVENQPVSIVWGERSKANVFIDGAGWAVTTVDVVPEPATLTLLALTSLAAIRRRR